MKKGVTLVEMMIAVAVISVGILGLAGAFKFFNIGIQSSKMRSLANNLAQERIEFLKNKSYYRILVTTDTDTDDRFDPVMVYDVAPNGSESITVGGVNFLRRVYIRKVNEGSDGNLAYFDWDTPDTGLKEILVYVAWEERGGWKSISLRNLINNPNRVNQSATFAGRVTNAAGGAAIAGAVVRAQENPSQLGETSATGDYSFGIEAGSYTLLAMKDGFFPKSRPQTAIASAQSITGQNFALTQMDSGTITGSAFLRDHLVISQVVGSCITASGNTEWVEVFNPTTWTWTMATGLGTGSNNVVVFCYTEAGESETKPLFDYRTTTLAPGSYFLFANTGIITAGGVTRTADAVYSVDGNFAGPPQDIIKTGNPSSAGHVLIGGKDTGLIYDILGWNATNNGSMSKKYATRYEGAPLAQSVGFEVGEEYTRKSSASGVSDTSGLCYDSNDNNSDFTGSSPLAHRPHNSSDSQSCVSGTPAYGGLAFTADPLSSPVLVDADGSFNLTNVATGTWTLYVSSGRAYNSAGPFGGASNGFNVAAGQLVLSSASSYGYVSGRVTDAMGVSFSDVKVFIAGFPPATTDGYGKYILPASTGLVNVVANYQRQKSSYVELTRMDVGVELGAITKDVDFSLYLGGKITGKITTNGVDPLPNIPVVGLKNGIEQGTGMSDNSGNFVISGTGVSTGTYVVIPQLEAGEGCSPSSATVTLTSGGTESVGVFTITGASGYVTGSVSLADGSPITTGALIYITSATISGDPPVMDNGRRTGPDVYYSDSSNAQGNYSIAVKGGYTYHAYAWYTTWNGETPNPVKRDPVGGNAAFVVNPNATVTKNFVW